MPYQYIAPDVCIYITTRPKHPELLSSPLIEEASARSYNKYIIALMETVASKLCQTIPRRKATVSLDNKTLKRSLAVHFQSYPLALAEKEQLATASAISGNYDSTQSAMPIPVMRNAESIRRKAEPIQHNIVGHIIM